MVRGKSMLTCQNCHAGNPEGMRFCLQCGSSLVPTATAEAASAALEPAIPEAPAAPAPVVQETPVPPTPPLSPLRQQRTPQATVNLKIAATPVMAPRTSPLAPNPRPSLGDDSAEIDEESLKKSFQRPIPHHPDAVVCRFCKGPLDLGGDYCEHCGAPVAEAAPPGMVPPKPKVVEPPPAAQDEDPLAAILGPAKNSAPPAASAPHAPLSSTGLHPSPTPTPAAKPAMHLEPQRTAPHHTPHLPPPPAHPEEQQAGLMGKLKGLFKKG